MTPLMTHLAALIAREGPITVADFMALALGHPLYGYYMTRDPLGRGGDFTTAPEISQMFGEIIGAWCIHTWRNAGAPAPFCLVELGPGRGTLMADLLRTARRLAPDFITAATLHLVETSPVLRARQRALLGDEPRWHASLDTVPDQPMLLIANEFFDALPLRQFRAAPGGWEERHIGLSEGKLVFRSLPCADPPAIAPHGPMSQVAPGTVVERRPAAESLVFAIAARLVQRGGAALIIDYGYEEAAAGDTLQAVRGHRYHDPLQDVGEADLTAHVDFSALAAAARRGGAQVFGPVPQGRFLVSLGLEARAARLMASQDDERHACIKTAAARLTSDTQMGRLFKVMALTPQGANCPAGFEGR